VAGDAYITVIFYLARKAAKGEKLQGRLASSEAAPIAVPGE